MKRRTLRRAKAASEAAFHHHVYVVLLDPKAAKRLKSMNPQAQPGKACVYVGMSGLTPEERFANHKAGIKAARIVQRFGIRLLPEFFAHLNPMPFEAAAMMEQDLAEDLRKQGYFVGGGT
jgi:hypothetical protein